MVSELYRGKGIKRCRWNDSAFYLELWLSKFPHSGIIEFTGRSVTYKKVRRKSMENKSSITALMSSFGRAFHAENEIHPVFKDNLAKALMTEDEYNAVQGYVLSGAKFFEPEMDTTQSDPKEVLFRRTVAAHCLERESFN